MCPYVAYGVQDCVIEARILLRLAKALLVGLDVCKVEWISRTKAAIDQLVAWFEERIQPLTRANLEVELALWADIHVGLKIGLPDGLPAARALDPKSLR